MSGATAVEALHAAVDEATEPLRVAHAERLNCRRGCSQCCVDELTVFAVEAARIAAWVGDRLRGAAPHPAGGCAFLDSEGACRVYPARPYVCRTQGLPLRWLEEDDEGEVVELRDVCALNLVGVDLTTLDDDLCWTLGYVEERLYGLQEAAGMGESDTHLRRVPLRTLFAQLASMSGAERQVGASE